MPFFLSARKPILALLATTALAVVLGGCSTSNSKKDMTIGERLGGGNNRRPAALSPERLGTKSEMKQSPLVKKTTKIANAYRKNPRNGDVALQYVYHLRALGMTDQSMATLEEAYRNNPDHAGLSSEYGRFLLGTGRGRLAKKVLNRSVKHGGKDWRTASALGTLAARDGRYDEAIEQFEKARKQQPKRASIVNNLALALALGGRADEAENMLRNADDSGRFGPRMRQNLALVLALQGKYDEAQDVATTDLPPAQAKANIAYLRRMTQNTEAAGVEFTNEGSAKLASGNSGPTTTAALPTPTTGANPAAPIALTPAPGPANPTTFRNAQN